MGISPRKLGFLGYSFTPIKESVRFHVGFHHIDSIADQLNISLFVPLDGGVNPIHGHIGIHFPLSLDVCHGSIGNGTFSVLLVPQCHEIVECDFGRKRISWISFLFLEIA